MLPAAVRAGRLQQHQHTATEATPHHPGADHLGHPGGELHEAVKLPAAYREIESKALMRCVENRPEAAGRAPARGIGRPPRPRILGDHVACTVSLTWVGDALEV